MQAIKIWHLYYNIDLIEANSELDIYKNTLVEILNKYLQNGKYYQSEAIQKLLLNIIIVEAL